MAKIIWIVQGWVRHEGNDILSVWETEEEALEARQREWYDNDYPYNEITVHNYEIGKRG